MRRTDSKTESDAREVAVFEVSVPIGFVTVETPGDILAAVRWLKERPAPLPIAMLRWQTAAECALGRKLVDAATGEVDEDAA